jgi:hypothetical protein
MSVPLDTEKGLFQCWLAGRIGIVEGQVLEGEAAGPAKIEPGEDRRIVHIGRPDRDRGGGAVGDVVLRLPVGHLQRAVVAGRQQDRLAAGGTSRAVCSSAAVETVMTVLAMMADLLWPVRPLRHAGHGGSLGWST